MIELMTVKDIAKSLRTSVRTVWRMKAGGCLPAPVRIGRGVRWDAERIKMWIDMGCPDQVTFEAKLRTQQKETGR